jgi:hypothetical protein
MTALFAEHECGPRRPQPIPPPSRAEQAQATLNAGIHPASGAPLRQTPPGEAARCCRSCAFCGFESDRPGRLVCLPSAAETGEPQRTQLGWPACVGFVPEPPAVLDGQTAIPGGA